MQILLNKLEVIFFSFVSIVNLFLTILLAVVVVVVVVATAIHSSRQYLNT